MYKSRIASNTDMLEEREALRNGGNRHRKCGRDSSIRIAVSNFSKGRRATNLIFPLK